MSDVSDNIDIITLKADSLHQLMKQNTDLVHQLKKAHTMIKTVKDKVAKFNLIAECLNTHLL